MKVSMTALALLLAPTLCAFTLGKGASHSGGHDSHHEGATH